jgi:DNA polymerase-3 subunit delta'
MSRRTPPQLRLEQIRGVSRALARQPCGIHSWNGGD